LYLVEVIAEEPNDMRGITGRADRHDRSHLGDVGGRGQDSGSAEAVSDQQLRRPVTVSKVIRGSDEVSHGS
jgi:hypothetical protein